MNANVKEFLAACESEETHQIIPYRLLREGAQPPRRAHATDAGSDVAYCGPGPIKIRPQEIKKVPTGISVTPPDGWEVQIRVRSSVATRGLVVANSPGTVDAGYTGELVVLLGNVGDRPVDILPGDRIAQLVPQRLSPHVWLETAVKPVTARGDGGGGSTGR